MKLLYFKNPPLIAFMAKLTCVTVAKLHKSIIV
jgi:hypothetical protein